MLSPFSLYHRIVNDITHSIKYNKNIFWRKHMKLKLISPEDLETYLLHYNCLLIDLRDKEDFQNGHIPGAVWADWEKLDTNIKYMLDEYNSNIEWIILYCDRGNISLLTARDLARHGYNVISLGGGYNNWQKHMNMF